MSKVESNGRGSSRLRLLLLSLVFLPNLLQATVTFEGTNGVRTIIDAECDTCHGGSTGSACWNGSGTWSSTQTAWYDTDSSAVRASSAAACVAQIWEKVDTAAAPQFSGKSYGGHMPSGCNAGTGAGCLSSTERGLINSWRLAGAPRWARPTVTTTTIGGADFDNQSATLRGTVDQNGASSTSTYFNWGTSSVLSGAATLNVSNPSGSGGNSVAANISGGISGLQCGRTYYYRAKSQNSQGLSTNTTIRNFTTDPCSVPTIMFSGPGSLPGTRITVSKNLTFTQSSLSISADDDDFGSLTWSIIDPAGGGTAVINNSSTGAFTYTAPPTAGPDSFTLVVTDMDPFTPGGGAGPNSASVVVYVTVTDNAPQFKTSLGGTVITSDSLTVSEGNGSAPSQSINLFAEDADGDTISWSIPIPAGLPSRGTLSAFSNPTGTTNSISYTPDRDIDINDSFIVRISDGLTNVDMTVTAVVTPVPDNPFAVDDGVVADIFFDIGVPVTIPVLADPNMPPDPAIGVDGDVDTGDSITVDPASITVSAGGATPVAVSGNTQIRYTSTMTQFTVDTFQYRVIDTTARTSNPATVTVTPRDTDNDGVINYLDNCAGTPNPAQTDTDGDQVINVNTTVDPGGDIGGDACDTDDDGDMISDLDEIANSLDPLDPTDATADNDGDGINNRDEINAGTNPNSPNLTIDATGYYTPFKLPTPDPKSFHVEATALTPSDPGPYRPGDNTITWTPSNSLRADLSTFNPGGLVSNPPQQPFYVRPLLNFGADQVAEEGDVVNVMLTLNGDAPSYPVTVSYSVSGSASAADYSAPTPASGMVVFNDTTPQTISFTLTAADGADAGETIRLRITGATNAAIGAKRTHTVTIIESNVAPRAALQFAQGGNPRASAVAGTVDISALVSDVNVGQAHNCDWTGTDNALLPPAAAVCAAWPTPALAPGNYAVAVRVTDDGSPPRSVSARRILNVIAAAPMLSNLDDTDGDTIDDFAEGFDDADGDGIPNYLDALDNSGANLLADQTADIADSFLVETEAGLTLTTGSTAQASASYGAMITDTEIEDFGDPSGGASRFDDDGFRHFGGVYDFRVTGMVPGSSARVVIPLQTSIPKDAEFRKFDPARGWGGFVEDDNNALASARGAPGACPEPGSERYRSGLNYLDNCLQLLIEDGGPNDNDHAVNGEVADPGTLGARLTDPEIEEVEDGGGQMSLWLLALLASLGLASGMWRRMVRRH